MRWSARRVLPAAVIVSLAAVGAVVTVRAPDGSPAPAPPAAPEASAFLDSCIDTAGVDSVSALNRFVAKVRGSDGFAGGDVGASVELQDGRQLFVFGDTLRAADFDGQRFVRNSMLVFSPGCGQAVIPRDHGAIVPDRSDGVGYWPMSVARIELPGYDIVGVGVQRVRATGGGVFDFENLGPAIARFDVPRGGVPELRSVEDIGPDDADPTRPMWGAAAVVDSGWVYIYGTSRPAEPGLNGFALRVARSRPAEVGRPATWTYWDGERWTRRATAAAELIGHQGGVSQTLSVFRVGQTWYALSKKDEFLGTDLTIWTAPRPTGPFTVQPAAAAIPSDAVTGTLRYMPLAHPDLLPRPGTMVVSYSVNNTDVEVIRDDPRRYRPRFLRVTLPVPAG
ncbi:DUF4185 domain-containing protein [Nocardioides nitrophenolicus]|uniref:DUF4185 domain-containing protein n=1 Tax=Nocardioides nitrophenolicus TaxID=60489 RepID=UPI00195ED584|nr:DUF4185 domain-containing protein [Nocardioides nitrophenolicus]MBM7517087.1 hypothetical protein [Nocardioides nitrophenolicus]